MQGSCTHHPPDCATLYRVYWQRIVRLCATAVSGCPDGTAEEVAQDVFLVAHRGLAEQRYRGEGALSAWLLGIARNLCAKVRRDTYRHSMPMTFRDLERTVEHQECDTTALDTARLTRMRTWLERERTRLQQQIMAAVHCDPPGLLEEPDGTHEALIGMRDSFQHLARVDRQAYSLLHMHVLQGVPVRELATLQGMSRSVMHRSLVQAKTTLRQAYQIRMGEGTPAPPG